MSQRNEELACDRAALSPARGQTPLPLAERTRETGPAQDRGHVPCLLPRRPLTAGLDLAHVVAGEPAGPAAVRALPPAPFLHPRDVDDVAFRKGQLVFIRLLEVKLGSYDQLIVAIIRHVLKRGEGRRRHEGHTFYTVMTRTDFAWTDRA